MLNIVKIVYLHYILFSMVKRTSKEYALDTNDCFKVKYGTLNKYNPDVIYIRAKAKLKALTKNYDYKSELKMIEFNFIKKVKKLSINTNLFDKIICTFETPDKGISHKNSSFIKYDIYLHPKTIKNITDYENDVKSLLSLTNKELITLCLKNNIVIF